VPVFVARDAGPVAAPVVPGSYGSAAVAVWEPERVVLRVRAPTGGFLVTTDRYAAGWTARVDGREAAVERVNLYFVGVALPPGEHDVVLAFDAGPLWLLAPLSAATALLAGLGGLALVRRERRPAVAAREADRAA
jgi:uncharacterized membrane protein YfhO